MENKIEKKGLIASVKKGFKIDSSNFLLMVTIGLFALMYIVGLILYSEQGFNKTQTFLNMLIDNAGLLIVASGMTVVMITGGIDISVGSVVGLDCMILAFYMEKMGMPAGIAILIVLGFGVIFGAFQGWLISYMELQPFVITLAGLFFCRGLTAIISSQQIAITKSAFFLNLANKNINVGLAIPDKSGEDYLLLIGAYLNKRGKLMFPFVHPSVIIALITVVIIWWMLKYTRFGRNLFAIGGNEQSALLMGINVKKTKFMAYMLEGFLASLGGLVFCLNTTSGFVEQARGFEMEAISSAVIGGTMLTGGVGTVVGTVFGVLIKATIESLIRFQGTLSSWWARIVLSAILCFFIVLQSVFVIIKNRNKK